MQTVDLQEDINAVAGCGPLKVWSVVVTVLGDLLQSDEMWLSGPLLDALVGRLGINNQALRVALHRLRRDGWVVTEKRGRLSAHQLTARGFAERDAVRAQVYGTEPVGDPVFLVVGAPELSAADFSDALPDHAVSLSARSALVAGSVRRSESLLVSQFAPDGLPPWVSEALAPEVMRAEYDELAIVVGRILARATPNGVMDRTALRLAILHHWRRMRLRHGAAQDVLLPADWEGARARRLVMQALARLERPEVGDLEP